MVHNGSHIKNSFLFQMFLHPIPSRTIH